MDDKCPPAKPPNCCTRDATVPLLRSIRGLCPAPGIVCREGSRVAFSPDKECRVQGDEDEQHAAPPPHGPAIPLLCEVCSGHGNQGCPYPKSHSRLFPRQQNWGLEGEELFSEQRTEMKGRGHSVFANPGPGLALRWRAAPLEHLSCRAAEALPVCCQPDKHYGSVAVAEVKANFSCVGWAWALLM